MYQPNSASNLNAFDDHSPQFRLKTSHINSIVSKELQIGSPKQESALPLSKLSFIRLLPLILLTIFRQGQVIYFIIFSMMCSKVGFVFLFQNFDGETELYVDWKSMLTHICLLLLYICLEIVNRYLTYQNFSETRFLDEEKYEFWSWEQKKWTPISQNNIKVGHILRISKKDALHENKDNKTRVPVNLLPLLLASETKYFFLKKRQIMIETFEIDKTEGKISIPINEEFAKQFNRKNDVRESIQNIRIEYSFHNPNSESFQGKILFGNGYKKNISNSDTVGRGSLFMNEDYMIGVALFNLSNKNIKNLERMLESENKISKVMKSHLLYVLLVNIFISVVFIGIHLVLTKYSFPQNRLKIDKINLDSYKFSVFNIMCILYFSVNIIMFIQLNIHRLLDIYFIKNKCNMQMRNCIKSGDEFGIADTLVMDEFNFVKENTLKVKDILINKENGIIDFEKETIYLLAHESKEFKKKFYPKWGALTNQINQIKSRIKLEKQFQIDLEETIDIDSSVLLAVSIKQSDGLSRYLFKFQQKIILSLFESLEEQKHQYIYEKVEEAKSNGQLMMMTSIALLPEEVILNKEFDSYSFEFHSLIKFNYTIHEQAVNFIHELQSKHNILIMTSNPIEYFERVLVSTHLMNQSDKIMKFEEADEVQFRKQLKEFYLNLQKNLYEKNSQKKQLFLTEMLRSQFKAPKRYLIAFDSSLLTFFSREEVKDYLVKLSQLTAYIIFYNCTQFHKQFCAASIFKIFPQHIYLSNFAIDSNIFRAANLSVSMVGKSGQKYATALAYDYETLRQFIVKECHASIEITSIIIKNNIFKNQILIFSLLTLHIAVYQGSINWLSLQYSSLLFMIYNLAFTILPMVYYIVKRPEPILEINHSYKDKLFSEHIKAILSGILISLLTFSVVPSKDMHNIFAVILINCIIMGNLHYLVVDNSVSKIPQIIVIGVQCLISLLVYLLTLFFVPEEPIFYMDLELSAEPKQNAIFYVSVFLVNPLFIVLWLYFLSFKKSIPKRVHKQSSYGYRQLSEVKVHMSKSLGKQMHFRGLDKQYDS